MLERDILQTIHRLQVPNQYQILGTYQGLHLRCLQTPSMYAEVTVEPYRTRREPCPRILATTAQGKRLVVEFSALPNDHQRDVDGVIRAHNPRIEDGLLRFATSNFKNPPIDLATTLEARNNVYRSWRKGIHYTSELVSPDGGEIRKGFRLPQIGALHALASHWTLSEEPAMVVMPTGTGKTEVMIAASIAAQCHRLLVIVPSDALREQTAARFESYSILRKIGVIEDLPYPVIGVLKSRPLPEHTEALERCNIVITTMKSIGNASDDGQRQFAGLFSHIFFDEAHHVEATTWKNFRKYCDHAKIVLFTATPFREDGKPLQGKIIYSFPLSEAQKQDLFGSIRFVDVFEPNKRYANHRIASAAVQRLREDLGNGYNHILLARADSIEAAEALFLEVYQPIFGDLNPVVIHSKTQQRSAVLERIKTGQHKIVICVDMFGEGFDLPNLKVAALHSVHKSLGITLQFIGRFSRTSPDVGPASFVANTAEDGVPESLENLYREDADWNLLVADLSYDAINPRAQLSELVANLRSAGKPDQDIDFSMLALRPKISAQVYRTTEFHPERFAQAFKPSQRLHQPQISREDNFLVLVVNQLDRVDWTDSREIALDNWVLYIAYFDPGKNLLYVHSSLRGEGSDRLARAISREPVLVGEEEVFKVFSGLKRLILHSVGLSSRNRNVRYQMFAGLDVKNAIGPVQQQAKIKSNVTGVGYEEGKRRGVGCSRKGKIWSMQSGSLADWKSWCDDIGLKLSNDQIAPDDFLRYTLIPTAISEFPTVMALMVDWPDQLFESSHFSFEVMAHGISHDFHNCELRIVQWGQRNSFQFALRAGEELESVFDLQLDGRTDDDSVYEVNLIAGPDVQIDVAGERLSAVEYFRANPPLVRLEDGSQLAGNILLKPQQELGETFDPDFIETIDWTGTTITKESRWKDGVIRTDSVQQRFIEELEKSAATFIIDDDDAGESADIVAIEETDDTIIVNLWHCKYSGELNPGQRADDLYVVCGQAQKSVKWTWSLNNLIRHLTHRETELRRGRLTRFLRGSLEELATLRKSARRKFVEYRVGIVQPGVRKATISRDHLALLGATNSFIQSTTNNPLRVVLNS